ncbi:MAG: Bug family tripartite tricarboxylate transporter substrate binding protein, partial [Advenella sp.]
YKGSAQAVSDLLGGQIQVSVDTLTILAPHIRAGKLRGLVVGAPVRSPLIPDVPSANTAALPGFIASGWFGVVVPAGTPQPIVQRLQQAIERIATSQETQKIFDENGITVEHNTPQQFAQLIQDDLLRWQKVIDTAKVPKVGY